MARLKERDRRPIRIFEAGDIVTPHPKRSDLITIGDGIVIDVKTLVHHVAHIDQTCHVFFAAREVDLWVEVRRWARDTFCSPNQKPEGLSIPGADLVYAGKSHPEWLDPPDMDEITLARFGEILE